MSTIRPRFPTDRRLVNNDGSITPAWDYYFRNLALQLPKPGQFAVANLTYQLTIDTYERTHLEFKPDGSTYLDNVLHFPTLTNDVTNVGLVTTLKNVGTPVNDKFVRITTDYAGRVSATKPVEVEDITDLVDPVYVNVTGDTMTGDLTVPNVNVTTNATIGNNLTVTNDAEVLGNLDVKNDITGVNTIRMDTASYVGGPLEAGAIRYNSVDKTLDIGCDGIIQQVGLETFAKVYNNTGSTISNGTVVGFNGAGPNDSVTVVPYIANGTLPTLYILGVMTEDVANGATGKATVWGYIHDINTSSFALGDVLYASPTVAGGLTNVKPTAPQNVIPIAAVTKVGGTDGVILVRPTIEQQRSYGHFITTDNQSPAAINTAYPITFSSTLINNGVTIGTPTSRLVTSRAGLFRLSFSSQLTSSSTSQKTVWIWVRKNGVDMPNSAMIVTSNLNDGYTPITRNDLYSLLAGDYIEYCWASDSTAVSLIAAPSTAFSPASPSAIVEFSQVQQ